MLPTTKEPLGLGAINDSVTDVIRKFLNPALKGPGWDSLIAALAAGDSANWTNAQAAFDQLFMSTASDVYLDRRASDQGVHRPQGVNMSDDLFRKLAITEKTSKLTQESFLEVLEVFYGLDATRASTTSVAAEPFTLLDGDDLSIVLDERKTVNIQFVQSHFSDIELATAEEVAAEITRGLADAGSQAYAVALLDPLTNLNVVKIYSGARGLASSIRIVGGRANTRLLFPESIFTSSGSSPFAVWNVTLSPVNQGNLRFTETSGIYDLFQVVEGDRAYIYGPEFSACNCNGTFPIEAVSVTYSGATKVQWFEIQNPSGVAASSISQTLFTDLMFFRPVRKTIYNNPRHVIVCEDGDHLDIVMPATTEVVGRGPGTAAYLNVNSSVNIATLVRLPSGTVTVTTSGLHHLTTGDQVIVDDVLASGTGPTSVPGTPSGDWVAPNDTKVGTTDASPSSTCSETHTYQSTFSKSLVLQSGDVMIVGGETAPGPSVNPNITIFQKTDETLQANGGYQQAYQWTEIANDGLHGFGGYFSGQRYFAACVLNNGDVLMAGGGTGDDITGTPSNGWDRLTYFPPGTVLQQGGNTAPAVMSGALAPAANGLGIFCGGWTVSGTALTQTHAFNPNSNAWSAKASMKVGRIHHAFTALSNGHLLATGGYDFTNPLCKCEIYDPTGDTWATTGAMTYARYNHAVVSLPDGRVIALGGTGRHAVNGGSSVPLASVEIYNPATGFWMPLPSMQVARDTPVAGYSSQRNCVIVAGGTGVASIEYLDIATMKWIKAPVGVAAPHANSTGCLTSHSNLSGTPVHDTFLVAGGTNAGSTEKKNYVFILGADNLTSAVGLNRHTQVAVVDGTHFTYDTSDLGIPNLYTQATTGKVTASKAMPAPVGVPGPFSYDTKTGLAITAVNGATGQDLNRDVSYSSLHLDTIHTSTPALAFPDQEGFLVFNFGFENVVGPIRYLGRLSDQDLIMDVSAPFPQSLPAGATVRLLSSREPFQPPQDQLVGNFYVTGTAAGRVAAQKTLDDIVAAGKQILVTIVYPGDRGLGAEGFSQSNASKLSDKVSVWGGDDLDEEIPAAQAGQ